MSFAQKVVLITGAGAGIGAATSELFVKNCATVALVDRDGAKLKAIAQCLEKLGGKTLAIEADLAKDKETDVIVKKTIDKFGKLDVLVNNAAILREAGILADHFLKTYDEVMNINIRGVARLSYFAAPYLIKTKGNIINVSSMAGISTTRDLNIAYRTSKAALNHFTRSAALELAVYGVRANTISPGPVRTGIFEGMNVDLEKMKNTTALKRLSEPYEIANMILYVASAKGKSITGSDFVLDNGTLLNYKMK